MRSKWKWMGNTSMDLYNVSPTFINKNPLALIIYTKSVFRS